MVREDEEHVQEMESMEETIEDRQQKMRDRANYLKQKREAERRAYVEQKMDEKFR